MSDLQAELQALKPATAKLSPADLSILFALPQGLDEHAEVRVTTIAGSASDALWTQLASMGWMTSAEALAEVPDSNTYVVTRGMRANIEALIDDIQRGQVVDVFDELRSQIPPLVVPRVIDAGGTVSDVAMVLAAIVESSMNRWIQPHLHEAFLKAVIDRAQDLAKARLR